MIPFPWEQPEKYENFVPEELGIPSPHAFTDLSPDSMSTTTISKTFEVLEKKKVSLDGISINLDDYERIIVQGNLILEGVKCIAEAAPRVHNGKMLIISKKLVLNGINVRVSGLQVVEGNVRLDGIMCQLDHSIAVKGLIKKGGVGCSVF